MPTTAPHRWVGASVLPLSNGEAQEAYAVGILSVDHAAVPDRVTVLDVYCQACRHSYSPALARTGCEASLCPASRRRHCTSGSARPPTH
jgi:hypothetical protein